MKSINEAFILLDKTLEQQKEIAKKINSHSTSPFFFGCQTCYNPDDRNHSIVDENKLLWVTDKPDHNGYRTVFLFKTTEKYPDKRFEAKQEILATSELRKVLLKNNITEVGISIENTLQQPTDIIWGWKFKNYEYYIIKDGKTTFSNKRSDIRKIYNGHEYKPERNLIRIDTDTTKFTIEVEEIYEIKHRKIYHVVLENDEEYYLGTDDSMRDYFHEVVMEDDWRETLIEMYGGKDAVIKLFFEGSRFNPEHLLMFDDNKNFCYFLGIDRDWHNVNRYTVESCNFNGHLEGLTMYKKVI